MSKFSKDAELAVRQLLADLTPEELEPRLELQVFVDPMATLVTAANNNNNNKPPVG